MANRTVKVDVKADVSDFNRGMLAAAASSKAFANSLDSSRNQMSGLIQAGLAFGPALVPITAAAIPAIGGLANQLAIAGGAAVVTGVAFQGVGDALGALNDAQLEPTAANFQKLEQAMASLSPAGQEFVHFLQDLRPEMQALKGIAEGGLFPGVQLGLEELRANGPLLAEFFGTVSSTIGDLFASAGDNLNDPRWQEFFAFLNREARPALESMGRSLGFLTEGFAQLWMAFDPLNDQFSRAFLGMSQDFATWASNLSGTQGFQDFIDYIKRVGPSVGDALGAIGNALVQLVQAAAVVGEVALPILELLADAFAGLMDSPIGPTLVAIAAGLAAVTTAMRIGGAANVGAMLAALRVMRDVPNVARGVAGTSRSFLDFGVGLDKSGAAAGRHAAAMNRWQSSMGRAAKIGGGVGGLAFVMSDLDNKMGLANTASLALAGTLGGPWGAAIGAGVGLVLDLAAAEDNLEGSMRRASEAAANQGMTLQQRIAAQDAALAAVERRRQELEAREAAAANAAGGRGSRFGAVPGQQDAAIRSLDEKSKGLLATRRELEIAAQEQAFAEAGLSGVMKGASQAARDETYALLQNIQAKNQSADAALNAFDAETNYRQALVAARQQASRNSAGIGGNTAAALANRQALSQLAGAWNAVADAGGATEGQMQAARKAFISAAVSMGVSEKRAAALADELLHLPSPKPKIDVQSNAKTVVERARAYLKSLKDRTVFIHVVRRLQGKSTHPGPAGPTWMGGPVGLAEGGLIPGTPPPNPRVDDLFGLIDGQRVVGLRSGEFIMNEPATKRFAPLFEAINKASMKGYAAGGAIGAVGGPFVVSTDLTGVEIGMDASGIGRIVRGEVHTQLNLAAHESNRRFQTTARGA